MVFTQQELDNIGRNSTAIIHDELQDNFHKRKCNNMLLADSYYRIIDKYFTYADQTTKDKMLKKADRVRSCGAYLEYRLDPNRLNEKAYQRLCKAFFCGDTLLCSLCSWRKARKLLNQLKATMSHLENYRFIFLTLTIQGVYADELYPAVDNMLSEAWHSLINSRRWKNSIHGFFRTVEVTHDTELVITKAMYERKRKYYKRKGLRVGDPNPSYDLYKPHIHALLAVKSFYFSKWCSLYITQKEWRELWQNALHVTYDPYVFVEVIYDKNADNKDEKTEMSKTSAILEAAKYTAKSQDYLVRGIDNKLDTEKTDEAVHAISSSLAGRRLVSWGGCFREAHRALDLDSIENGNLLHTDTAKKEGLSDFLTFTCVWRGYGGYDINQQ